MNITSPLKRSICTCDKPRENFCETYIKRAKIPEKQPIDVNYDFAARPGGTYLKSVFMRFMTDKSFRDSMLSQMDNKEYTYLLIEGLCPQVNTELVDVILRKELGNKVAYEIQAVKDIILEVYQEFICEKKKLAKQKLNRKRI